MTTDEMEEVCDLVGFLAHMVARCDAGDTPNARKSFVLHCAKWFLMEDLLYPEIADMLPSYEELSMIAETPHYWGA